MVWWLDNRTASNGVLSTMARKFTLQSRTAAGDIDFGADLNPEQLAVATAPGGPMLVVAGAGSGKTRALTYRLAWLVHHGVDPGRIMLVTFTNRAAREMLNRVELLVKQKTKDIWGGTFHHIANRILRIHGQRLGISPDFTILDREDAKDLLASSVEEAGVDTRERRFPQKNVLAAISSFLQNTLDPLQAVITKRFPMFIKEMEGIEKVLVLYTEKKRARQLLDFDDLLSAWLRLMMEHTDVREMLAGQFQHVLVDEYQDTNAIQGMIVDLLASKHRNLTVVGDDSQSIYSFRGANFENIITFNRRYPDAREYKLETNYRSVPEILTLANASIAQNNRRLPKNLKATRSSGLKPAIVACQDHFTQSRFIAEYVLHLLDQGRTLNDIAVLYRSHWHSLEIQLEFQRRNIPFHIRGGLRFFEQAHMKDILCYLRVTQNPHDELAWLRLLKMLPRVGSAISRRVWQHISSAADPFNEVLGIETASLLPIERPALLQRVREPAQGVSRDRFARGDHRPGEQAVLRRLPGLALRQRRDATRGHQGPGQLRRPVQERRGLPRGRVPGGRILRRELRRRPGRAGVRDPQHRPPGQGPGVADRLHPLAGRRPIPDRHGHESRRGPRRGAPRLPRRGHASPRRSLLGGPASLPQPRRQRDHDEAQPLPHGARPRPHRAHGARRKPPPPPRRRRARPTPRS